MKRFNYLPVWMVLVWLLIGIYTSGIWHPDTIICQNFTENTAPDFEVICGEDRLLKQVPNRFKKLDMDFSALWSEQDFGNSPPYEEAFQFYFMRVEIIGVDKECRHCHQSPWNPKIKSTSYFSVGFFTLLAYGFVGLAFFIWLILEIWRGRKRGINESKSDK